jgi:phytoene synthase
MNAASTCLHPRPGAVSGEITAASKSNFVPSFFFLPKNRREGITHFYALSRVIDDAVDEAATPQEAESRIAFWKREVALCYEGTPTHPVALAMQGTIRAFDIPRHYLELLIEGCEMDLSKNRYENFAELKSYCYRVAGVIGLTCMKIFGLDGEAAAQAAEDLGMALQLTNILRDVAADGQKDRIYIPQDELRRFQVAELQLREGDFRSNLRPLFSHQADRAQDYFDAAFAEMQRLPRRPLVAAWIMGKIYQKLLEKVRRKGFDVYSKKLSLSPWTKTRIAISEWIQGFKF